jgi:hypothetical protein
LNTAVMNGHDYAELWQDVQIRLFRWIWTLASYLPDRRGPQFKGVCPGITEGIGARTGPTEGASGRLFVDLQGDF